MDRRQLLAAAGLTLAAGAAPSRAWARRQAGGEGLAIDFTRPVPPGLLSGAIRSELEEGTGAPIGARVEAAGRNHAWSTGMEGAQAGSVGSGGSLPGGWRISLPRGLSVEVLSASDGALDLRLTGQASTDDEASIAFGPASGVAVDPGEEVTASFDFQVVGSPDGVAGFAIWLADEARDASERTSQDFVPQSDTLWPVELRRAPSAAAGLCHGVAARVSAGGAVDATLRLRRPQLERAPSRTSFIPSTDGTGRRAADRLTVLDPAPHVTAGAWAATTRFRAGVKPTGAIREWTVGGQRLTLLIQNHVVRLELSRGETAGEAVVLGRICRFAPCRVALSVQEGRLTARLNQGPARSLAVGAGAPEADQLGFGRRGPFGGWIADVTLLPRALSDAELLAMSASGAVLDDAFDRADTELTGSRAPTGQTWAGVEAGENPAVTPLRINSRAVVTPDSGAAATAAYSGMTFSSTPRAMRAVGRLEPGEGNDSWVLIANPHGVDDVTDITTGSFHLVFTTTQADLGYFDAAGSLLYAATPAYPEPLASGAIHQMGVRIVGQAAILEMPDGQLLRFVDPALTSQVGPHWVMEIFRYGTGAPRCVFLAVQVEA